MQYMLMIYGDEKAWEKFPEEQRAAAMEQYHVFIGEIVKSGQFRSTSRLQPTAHTTTLREKNGKRVTTDGPFVETKEQLGGYFIVECRDLDEAMTIAWRIPGVEGGGLAVEVRPLVPLTDGARIVQGR